MAVRRDQILTELNLRAKSGDNQFTKRGGTPGNPTIKTTEDIAAEIGISKSTLKEDKSFAKKAIPAVKEAARKKEIKKKEAIKISKKTLEVQEEMLAEILSDNWRC